MLRKSFSCLLIFATVAMAQKNVDPVKRLGIPVPVSEARGFLAVQDADGKKWILGFVRDILPEPQNEKQEDFSRASLLVIDPLTGHTEQYFHPDPATPIGSPFNVFFSSRQRLYTTMGRTFLEFDLASRTFTFADTVEVNNSRIAFSMCEGADGIIYFACFPDSHLYAFDPEKCFIRSVARLDSEQKYPTTMAIDDDGWIYAGLGTVKRTLAAYHLQTKELRQLVPESGRDNGYAAVYKWHDGKIYASLAPDHGVENPFRLVRGGTLSDVKNLRISGRTAPRPPNSLYALQTALRFSDGSFVKDLDLISGSFTYCQADGSSLTQKFSYQSAGASISAIALGSNGKIYGSTDHPMILWEFDPESEKFRMLGHIQGIGGGNMTHIVNWKDQLVSNTYSRGKLYRFNPRLPFQDADDGNPRLLASSAPDVQRPRVLLAHPDGRHVVSAGWPGYGLVGGGMLIYDMVEEKTTALLNHEKLSPGQSITAMTALPDGNLVFGTSIATPGGSNPATTEAQIGFFNWETKTTEWLFTPIPGCTMIWALVCHQGKVLGINQAGELFLLNLEKREVERKVSLEKYGEPIGRRGATTFLSSPDGRLFAVMAEGILEVNPHTLETRLLAKSPLRLRDGIALQGDKLYAASWTELLFFTIPPIAEKDK